MKPISENALFAEAVESVVEAAVKFSCTPKMNEREYQAGEAELDFSIKSLQAAAEVYAAARVSEALVAPTAAPEAQAA